MYDLFLFVQVRPLKLGKKQRAKPPSAAPPGDVNTDGGPAPRDNTGGEGRVGGERSKDGTIEGGTAPGDNTGGEGREDKKRSKDVNTEGGARDNTGGEGREGGKRSKASDTGRGIPTGGDTGGGGARRARGRRVTYAAVSPDVANELGGSGSSVSSALAPRLFQRSEAAPKVNILCKYM